MAATRPAKSLLRRTTRTARQFGTENFNFRKWLVSGNIDIHLED